MKATSIAVLFVLLEAITIGVPWRQCVRVALTSEGAAVSGRRFRLVSGDARFEKVHEKVTCSVVGSADPVQLPVATLAFAGVS